MAAVLPVTLLVLHWVPVAHAASTTDMVSAPTSGLAGDVAATQPDPGSPPDATSATPADGGAARLPLVRAAAASVAPAIPPPTTTQWTASYWNNTTLSGAPVRSQVQSQIGFNTSGVVAPGVNTTNWSAQFTSAPQFIAGTYTFTVTADDGVELSVDGVTIIKKWMVEPATTYTASVSLAAGAHTVNVLYFQATWVEILSVDWSRTGDVQPSPPPDPVWQANYYNNIQLSGPPVLTQRQDTIGFNTSGVVEPGVNVTAWSASFRSRPEFQAGTYTFTVTVDDGVQLWVDGTLVLDHWVYEAATTYSVSVPMTAGAHDLVLYYMQYSWTEVLDFSYSMTTSPPTATPPPSTTAPPPAQQNSPLSTLIDDITLPNAAHPHGIPSSYSFYAGPELDNKLPPPGMTAATSWGVIYEAAEGSPAVNTRVEVRNQELWLWSNGRQAWVGFQASPRPAGSNYYEPSNVPFANQSYPAALRVEPDSGVSVKMDHGAWFHFWPAQGRVSISPSDIGGVFTTYQARLVVDDPSKPDDTGSARYVASAGSDWWASLNAAWPNNSQVFYDRFVYLTPSWQSLYGASWTPAQLTQNPPPLPAAN